MAKQLSNQANWKPWKGVILFVIAFVIVVAGSIMASFTGAFGTLFTQLGLLAEAVIACLINRTPLKEVFPLKKLTARDFFGTLLMWMGALPLGLLSTLAIGKLMPETYTEVVSGINDTATGFIVVGMIAMVICPPICEEAIMRGAILSNFRGVKKDWIIIVVVGIMFGLLHLDPIRLLNTAFMGGCMAYIMVKRNNFVLPMIFHFANNLLTIGMSSISTIMATQQAEQAGQSVDLAEGVSAAIDALPAGMILTFLCPMIVVIGAHLIKRQAEISEGREQAGMKLGAKIGLSVIPCVMLLGGGILLTACSMN